MTRTTHPARTAKRTGIVWGAFVGGMTIVSGLLLIDDGTVRSSEGAMVATATTLVGPSSEGGLVHAAAPLERDRWRSVVIHHSGSPAGDAESLHRQHVAEGRGGLGYHFVIGNGNGIDDGVIHMGYRWNDQAPGRHAIGENGPWLNEHAVAVCLIGNGDLRPFSERQITRLTQLVQRLQREFGIPAERVYLHRDVAGVDSPGAFFPEAAFREQLLRDPR